MSWREGHAYARVLQLCWRVCPHHLLPGMPVVCCLAQTCAWAFLRGSPPPGATSLLSRLSSTCLAAGWAVLGSPLPSLLPFPAGLHGAHHHLPEHRSALQHGLSPGNHRVAAAYKPPAPALKAGLILSLLLVRVQLCTTPAPGSCVPLLLCWRAKAAGTERGQAVLHQPSTRGRSCAPWGPFTHALGAVGKAVPLFNVEFV